MLYTCPLWANVCHWNATGLYKLYLRQDHWVALHHVRSPFLVSLQQTITTTTNFLQKLFPSAPYSTVRHKISHLKCIPTGAYAKNNNGQATAPCSKSSCRVSTWNIVAVFNQIGETPIKNKIKLSSATYERTWWVTAISRKATQRLVRGLSFEF